MSGQTSQVFGLHAVTALLRRNPQRVVRLHVLQGRDDARTAELLALADAAGIACRTVGRRELDALSAGGVHQGVVAEAVPSQPLHESDLDQLLVSAETPLLLVLDGVQDPHNLGACLRTADAAGADAVIAPRDRACGLNATVRKVAAGAAEAIPFIQVTNLARTLDLLGNAGITRVGLAGEADQALFDTDLRSPLALVLGAEGKGMRRLTRDRCDRLVRLPMAGSVESLNVSVATGICLYEAVRQRQTSP